MRLKLFLIFTIVPLLELYVLIRIGKVIGPLPTLGLLVLAALAGAWLARQQGFLVLRQIREELAAGRVPAGRLIDGALVIAGGILLVTPGFFTDILGLFFLIPATRSVLKKWLGLRIRRAVEGGRIIFRGF